MVQNAETLAFHRRRIETLSNTLGAWRHCEHIACRRKGACARAADVFPACVPPVLREMNASIRACLAAFPDVPPREPVEPVGAQIERINKRLINMIEENIDRIEQKRAHKHATR